MQTLNAQLQVDSWTPGISHLQHDPAKVHVLRGKNFRWTQEGIYSGWGNDAITNGSTELTSQAGVFTILDTTFVFIEGVVYKVLNCELVEVFSCDWTFEWHYPWSTAVVGGVHYFCNPNTDLIFYDPFKDEWGCWSSDCFAKPYFSITESANRLVLLQQDVVGWSAIDEGLKLDCVKGSKFFCQTAGFQSLSHVKYGVPLKVQKTSQGFVTYTSQGIMYSKELTQGGGPAFNHTWITERLVPLNPFAITATEGFLHYFVAKNGLYQVNEATIQPWENAMGRYLKEQELPDTDNINTYGVYMDYCWETETLSVSICDNDTPYMYTKALVYQFDIVKWCSFDQLHNKFGTVGATVTNEESEYVAGFVDTTRTLRVFNNSNYISGAGLGGCTFEKEPLDSWIEIGTWSYTFNDTVERMLDVTNVVMEMEGNGLSFNTITTKRPSPYTLDSWEENTQKACVFDAYIIGTLDGYQRFEDQKKRLQAMRVTDTSAYYACHNIGVYNTLLITATKLCQFYHLKTIRVSGVAGQRL